jgi:hypothetical protein
MCNRSRFLGSKFTDLNIVKCVIGQEFLGSKLQTVPSQEFSRSIFTDLNLVKCVIGREFLGYKKLNTTKFESSKI